MPGAALHSAQGPAAAVHEDVKATAPSKLVPVGGLQIPGEAEETSGIPLCFANLPVGLEVSVPVREFRVRNLLAMAPGEIIETLWGHGEDLPLASGDVQLAWTEFEVVDTRLAVRVTRLI
jgi:hypothetical protein